LFTAGAVWLVLVRHVVRHSEKKTYLSLSIYLSSISIYWKQVCVLASNRWRYWILYTHPYNTPQTLEQGGIGVGEKPQGALEPRL
jgi:hypothetical protein